VVEIVGGPARVLISFVAGVAHPFAAAQRAAVLLAEGQVVVALDRKAVRACRDSRGSEVVEREMHLVERCRLAGGFGEELAPSVDVVLFPAPLVEAGQAVGLVPVYRHHLVAQAAQRESLVELSW
jgi:hypothetical protein